MSELHDVNADGRLDLVLSFDVDVLALAPDDTLATLTARLPGDRLGCGFDHVRVVPPARSPSQIAESAIVSESTSALAIRTVSLGPKGGRMAVELSLPLRAPAALELLDVSGRRLASRAFDSPEPGRHVVEFDEAAGLPGGVYFARITQGSRARTTRALLIR